MTTTSRWVSQRRTTCATDLPCAAPICGQRGVGEQVVAAFGERPPGLDLDAALAHQLLVGGPLEERVALDLVDGRRDLVVVDQVDEPVGVEVRDADRADQAVAVQLLHRAPGAVVVAERLVDQVQVEVVEPEPLRARRRTRAWRCSSPASWIHSLVVTNSSSRGMPLVAIARPTASSLP